MLLAIDVGNTRINCGLFKEDKLITTWSMPTGGRVQLKKRNFTAAVISSVVPKVTRILKKILTVPVLEVNSDLDLGLKIRYKNPGQVGADRLANAVAAKNLYGIPALIVDFGTATTIDVVSRRGDYLGGVILPGIDMVRKGLKDNTALLPLVSLKRPKKVLGQNTKEAIQSGLYYGFCGMIKQLVLDLKKELRFPKKTVIIATGGYAELFAKGTPPHQTFWCGGIGVKVDSALTLQGLRLIYERKVHN